MTAIRPSKKSIEPITIIIVAAKTIHPTIGRDWESLYAALVAAISTSLGSLGDADTCRPAHSLLQTGRREEAEGQLGVVLPAELRRLWLALVAGLLQDRRDIRVGDEVLPALGIPVEEGPDAVGLIGIAEYGRTLGPVLLSLGCALGRKDLQEAVEILDLGGCQNHLTPSRRRLAANAPLNHHGTRDARAEEAPTRFDLVYEALQASA